MQTLLMDIRYAVRQARQNLGQSVLIIFILALGIGANCAIFNKLNQLLFQPLPGREPEQVVHISTIAPEGHYPGVSYLDLKDYGEQSRVFERVSASGFPGSAILRGMGEPTDVTRWDVSPELLSVLGFKPLLGRGIEPGDCVSGAAPIVLISYQFWRGLLNGRADVLGQSLLLNDEPYTVVGVLPREFWVPRPGKLLVDAFKSQASNIVLVPMVPPTWMLQNRGLRGVLAYGRLNSGVTIEQARLEMTDLSRRLELRYPDTNRNTRSHLADLRSMLAGQQKATALFLFAAVGLVLLIACANISHLLLARSISREREMAVRVSLGANNWRLTRQLLTESLMLGLAGGFAGLLVARVGQDLLNFVLHQAVVPNLDFHPDWRVLAYAFLVSLLTGLLFGLAPAWQVSRLRLNDSLKETGWSVSTGVKRSRFQKMLVGAEITLSMVLLIGAGLLARSLWRLLQVNPGFRAENVIYIKVIPSALRSARKEPMTAFYNRIQSCLETIPGVEHAGLSISAPMSGESSIMDGLRLMERPEVPTEKYLLCETVGPGYFDALGIPLKNGRDFSALDRAKSAEVAIINETLARKYWGTLNPVGTHLLGSGEPLTVIGVAGDTHHDSLETPEEPYLYRPVAQSDWQGGMFVIVRGSGINLADLADKMRRELRSLDATLFMGEPVFLEKALRSSMANRHEILGLIGSFVLLALVLTLSGIYGVLSNFVAQRTREIGIRMAMGATAGKLISMVMRQALWVTLVGIATGGAVAFGLSQYIASQLYSVTKDDPLTYVGMAILFLIVAALAAYLPARRAMHIQPVVALHSE